MDTPEPVTASEIGDFAFCPESLRLRLLGHKSANQRVLDRGTIHHSKKQAVETRAGNSIATGWLIVILALLTLAGWMIWR